MSSRVLVKRVIKAGHDMQNVFTRQSHLRHDICKKCGRLISMWPWSGGGSSVSSSRDSLNKSWTQAVSEAEKIVGYPTSFMSLRCLLSDEMSNVALHMRKLVGTKHPLLKTARGFVYDGKHSMQTRGLIVLLLSKAASVVPGHVNKYSDSELIGGIHKRQRTLAEIVEMIYTANLIHKGVVNMESLTPEYGSRKDMEFGNKISILSGDFLLANACTGLAELENTQVVENISIAIGDLMEAEFTPLVDQDGNPSIARNSSFNDWLHRTYKSSGSLMARSCLAAMQLGEHGKDYQDAAYDFGENIIYSYQLQEDMKPFLSPKEYLHQFTISSAPVLKCLSTHYDPLINAVFSDENIDVKKIINMVLDTDAVEECRQMCQEFRDKAKSALNVFHKSDATEALMNMVNARYTEK